MADNFISQERQILTWSLLRICWFDIDFRYNRPLMAFRTLRTTACLCMIQWNPIDHLPRLVCNPACKPLMIIGIVFMCFFPIRHKSEWSHLVTFWPRHYNPITVTQIRKQVFIKYSCHIYVASRFQSYNAINN